MVDRVDELAHRLDSGPLTLLKGIEYLFGQLVFPRFEGHLSAFGESRRKLTKEVRSAEDKTAFPA